MLKNENLHINSPPRKTLTLSSYKKRILEHRQMPQVTPLFI